jgi:uncharacterized protein YoxC
MKTQLVKMVIPTMIGGELVSVNEKVEVTIREAQDLIARGRAILHDVEDVIENVETAIDNVKQAVKTGRKGKA